MDSVSLKRTLAAMGLLAGMAIPAAAQSGSAYRDVQGRYTLRIPSGWSTVQMNSDAVQFNSGAAFVTMLVLPGTDIDMMLNTIGTSTGQQWKNFTEARRGDAKFGGRTGKYVTYSGVNPMGADSFFQMLSIADGQVLYLLMTSAPKAEFTRMKGAFDQIEQSFTLTPAGKGTDALPPAPAGAIEGPKSQSAMPPAPNPSPSRLAAPTAGTGGGNVYRMKKVRIVDERGFEQPMTALSLLIPTDWQFQGSVQYGQGAGCHANLVHLVFRATSPDGRLAIELFPGNSWQWTDDLNMRNMMQQSNQQMARFGARGCDIMAPMTADEFLRRSILPAVRRGARVIGAEAMPDAMQRMQEEASEAQQLAARQGIRVNIRANAGRVRVSDTQGEEWFTAMTTSIAMAGPSFNIRTGRMGQAQYYSSTADHVFAVRAPEGQLDAQEKFFQMVLGTVHVDPQWQARVEQAIATLNAQDIKGANDRSAIATKAGQDMAKMIHDSYQNATNSREHSMAAWSQYMRGVQSFRNPNTGEVVELSNQYGNAWAGADGTFVVTDSGSFNPNSSLQGSWTKLETVPR
jgi:hypothetical protein